MSLDFMAPGSLPASGVVQRPAHSHASDHSRRVRQSDSSGASQRTTGTSTRGSPYPGNYHVAASNTPWTSVNNGSAHPSFSPTSSYSRRYSSSTASSYAHQDPADAEHLEPSDTDRDSPSARGSPGSPEPQRREPRLAYGEEERAFIMVCAVLRGMTWKEIEQAFRERFPAGAKRRHAEVGLWPTYPEQERTAGGLTCAYYRIREQWGITKVRGVPDEMKPEVKNVVRQVVRSMTQFPDLQAWV
ncbi:hypothetical protein K490DRAFT_66723 [Saccharata proteae CBS 121410]|uniref:Uncharacterized protein n=1 Tax=Saccharata proteae CBS 121410 TaxID=1314787 RepID=A0A9P4HRB9_9PEZI|nr:hypothetical protein K490DRAFT_66723 [Saccharata proteae CBS 121410]